MSKKQYYWQDPNFVWMNRVKIFLIMLLLHVDQINKGATIPLLEGEIIYHINLTKMESLLCFIKYKETKI